MTKKLTLQDAINAIATLTTTVTQRFSDAKADRQLIKADILRLDQKFGDLYKKNQV